MSDREKEFQALRQLAVDYRAVVNELKSRHWTEEPEELDFDGLITSTDLKPPAANGAFIGINFDFYHATMPDGDNSLRIQLVTKRGDRRMKIFKAEDLARVGHEDALESVRATVITYADEIEN
jgi:hypothetical protein